MKLIKFLALLMLIPGLCFGEATRDFDGDEDMINYGSGSSIDSFTLVTHAAWKRLEAYTQAAGARIQGKASTSMAQVGPSVASTCGVGSGGECLQFFADWSGTDGSWYTNQETVPINQWDFVSGTYNSGATTNDPVIYVGGVSQTITERTTPTTAFVDDASSDFRVGNNAIGPGIRDWDGQLGYHHYYNRILTAVEINEIMWKPGIIANGLFLFAPQWGAATEQDLSGNGNTGTLTNTTAVNTYGPPVMFGGGLPL